VLFTAVCQDVSQMIAWEVYNTMISFLSKGFPPQRPDWRVIYSILVYGMYFQHVTLSTFSIFSFFVDCNILFNGTV